MHMATYRAIIHLVIYTWPYIQCFIRRRTTHRAGLHHGLYTPRCILRDICTEIYTQGYIQRATHRAIYTEIYTQGYAMLMA